MTPESPWRPSNWENHALWWSRLIVYWISAIGVVYEAYLKEPIGMIAFVTLGTGIDVGRATLTLVKVLHEEAKTLEHRIEETEDTLKDSLKE